MIDNFNVIGLLRLIRSLAGKNDEIQQRTKVIFDHNTALYTGWQHGQQELLISMNSSTQMWRLLIHMEGVRGTIRPYFNKNCRILGYCWG